MEYLDSYSTSVRHVARKVATVEGRLYLDLAVNKECTMEMYCSGWVDLVYNCYDRYLLDAAWTWVKGMMTTIGCAGVVSVSASCGRHCNLT